MRILIGYLIRAHVGPFVFALTALTGLLFVNAIAQRLQDLMGKGLTRDVVLEFMVLSIPHTIALTLPMAVLVSVLYAFSDLAANNEITAMKAGGVQPQRLTQREKKISGNGGIRRRAPASPAAHRSTSRLAGGPAVRSAYRRRGIWP